MQVLTQLDSKYQDNLNTFLATHTDDCKEIGLRARAIAAIGQIALKTEGLQPNQREIASIFGEVFSDIILSVYFTACALDKPAQSVLRRGLELGVAIVYLWDLPHAFWGWKMHDSDLNFNEMVEHLSKSGYKSFLSSLLSGYDEEEVLEDSEVRRLYRILSNTIHGKITTHESNLPDRFSYNFDDCKCNLDLISRVQKTLLHLFRARFPNYFLEMSTMIPAINTII